jgi:hypothetical protein
MRATTCLNREDTFGRKSAIFDKKLLILAGENIVRYRG